MRKERAISAWGVSCQRLESRLLLAGGTGAVVDEALASLSAEFSAYKSGPGTKPFAPKNKSLHTSGVRVAIEAAGEDVAGLKSALAKLHLRGAVVSDHVVGGWFPMGRISQLSAMGVKGLRFVRPALFTSHVGNTTTQGDAAMRADIARSQYNLSGAGVKVGILSDSFDGGPGSYSADITSGDLPSGVTILQDSTGTDEGRAMAQIVHDVAPGASLLFATANGGQNNFANNIHALANSGARIIVDDVVYFAEPMFQDGPIAQAIDDVVAQGVTYFSAAGNEGHNAFSTPVELATAYVRNAFGSIGGAPKFGGGTSIDFDPGPGIDDQQLFSVAGGTTVNLSVQWDQPFFSVSGGQGNRSDMDVYVLDAGNNRVVAGATSNDIGGDAVETVQFSNNGGSSHSYYLMILHAGGVVPTQVKYIAFGNITIGDFAQPQAGAVFGHANAAGATAVAAAAFNLTPTFGVDPAQVESYSSQGATPILFDTDGFPILPINRQQPKLTAPDGGNTTFFGQDSGIDADSFPNFFGTSAAAPHAAAVAALLLQAKPSLTPAQVVSAMQNTALDMDGAGVELRTGYGLVAADGAVRSVRATGSISGHLFIDKNGDGVLQAGEAAIEGQSAFLDANNNGIAETASTSRSSNAAQVFGATGLISAPISVSGIAGWIDTVNLSLNLSHPNVGELAATLISPAGTRVPISLPGDGHITNAVVAGVRGENPNGIWRLEIIDPTPVAGQGSLANWSLAFVAGDINASADSAGAYSFPHLEAWNYSVRSAMPTGFIQTVPPGGVYSVSLAPGASIGGRDIGYFPTHFVGTSGNDSFVVQLDGTGSRLEINDYSIAKNMILSGSGVGSLSFDTGDGDDQLSINLDSGDQLGIDFQSGIGADSLVIQSGQIHLDSLGGENLSIDLASEDGTLILTTTTENREVLLAAVNDRLRQGRNGGLWDGPGINSSGAAANIEHTTGLAAVGGWQLGSPVFGENDIVLKLVRNGDSDLDGDIDPDDFARVDGGWMNPPASPSYFTGDLDYSGEVDADDFFAIDRAFSA